ncbi:transmembrane protein [Thraustotheca clavata]|uniref:Transmembrane protein n=1 Tax=Thraustotheca clavata TaxID=74557 RepID=A0A1V9ZI14_9STRA|nr:transmembrane protein [Thraustotheca clavata]
MDNLEELDEFDYDPDFFNGIFPKEPVAKQPTYPESPSLTGYTSEESDYSATTTDASHWSPGSSASSNTTTSSKKGHPTMNDGMMTNGKTSLYRGVTRTSKTAWGAKYSSKRIINTCRTQEEAARAYDAYLKENVPDKYHKYANFCPNCDLYTNSLGLTWAKKECKCNDTTKQPNIVELLESEATDHEMDQSNQAMEDFMKDEEFTFSSPVKATTTTTEQRVPYLAMSSFEAQHDDDIFIKAESKPTYQHSSSFPDDDVLSTILNATAPPKTISPLHLESPDLFAALNSLENRDSLTGLQHASSSLELLDAFQNTTVSEFDPQIHVIMETVFLRKYFRNDRKNLQCFPYCREHGNYYEAKMQGLEHAGKGVCRAPVKVKITHPTPPMHMIVLARCQTINRSLDMDAPLSITSKGLKDLQQSWTLGNTSETTHHATSIYFLPEVWKFDAELPKKRRIDDNDTDDLNYVVQVVIYTSEDGESYKRDCEVASNGFDIQSTRTLLRQKQKKDEDVLFNFKPPERKKLRTNNAQYHRTESSLPPEAMANIDLKSIDWGDQGESFEDYDDEDEAAMEHVPENEVKTPPSSSTIASTVSPNTMPAAPAAPITAPKTPAAPTITAAPTTTATPTTTAPPAKAQTGNLNLPPVTYTRFDSPKTAPRAATAAAPLSTPDVPKVPSDWKTQFAFSLLLYGAINIPLGLVFLILHLFLLPVSLVLPKAGFVIQFADGLADMDLYFANSLSPKDSGHASLNRINTSSDMARRHLYFLLLKTPVNLIGLVGCLVLNLIAIIFLIVPPLSKVIRGGANACGMLAVNASRTYCGKPSSFLQQAERTV